METDFYDLKQISYYENFEISFDIQITGKMERVLTIGDWFGLSINLVEGLNYKIQLMQANGLYDLDDKAYHDVSQNSLHSLHKEIFTFV